MMGREGRSEGGKKEGKGKEGRESGGHGIREKTNAEKFLSTNLT